MTNKGVRVLGVAAAAFLLTAGEVRGQDRAEATAEKDDCGMEITAVIPSRAPVSAPVTIYGRNFEPKTALLIGDKRYPVTILDERSASFAVPNLQPGAHEFYLKRDSQCRSGEALLRVTEKKPVIATLSPDRLYYCTPSEDREVIMKGENFGKDTKVLFDKIVVGRKFIDKNRIEVKIPQAESGLHYLTAVNPDGTDSLPQNFYIEGRPVIYSITLGLTYDEHYELVVEGENFLWGAQPLINGERLDKGATYQGCNRLVYDRTYAPEHPEEISIQIVNPDGEKSDPFYLTVP